MPLNIINLLPYEVNIIKRNQTGGIISTHTFPKSENPLIWHKSVQTIEEPCLIKHDVWDICEDEFNLNYRPKEIDGTLYITTPDIVIAMLAYYREDFIYPENPIFNHDKQIMGYEWLRKL